MCLCISAKEEAEPAYVMRKSDCPCVHTELQTFSGNVDFKNLHNDNIIKQADLLPVWKYILQKDYPIHFKGYITNLWWQHPLRVCIRTHPGTGEFSVFSRPGVAGVAVQLQPWPVQFSDRLYACNHTSVWLHMYREGWAALDASSSWPGPLTHPCMYVTPWMCNFDNNVWNVQNAF